MTFHVAGHRKIDPEKLYSYAYSSFLIKTYIETILRAYLAPSLFLCVFAVLFYLFDPLQPCITNLLSDLSSI